MYVRNLSQSSPNLLHNRLIRMRMLIHRIPHLRARRTLTDISLFLQLQLLILRKRLPCRCCPPACSPAIPPQECADWAFALRDYDWCLYVSPIRSMDLVWWGCLFTEGIEENETKLRNAKLIHRYRPLHPPRSRPGRLLRRQGPGYPRRAETAEVIVHHSPKGRTRNHFVFLKRMHPETQRDRSITCEMFWANSSYGVMGYNGVLLAVVPSCSSYEINLFGLF